MIRRVVVALALTSPFVLAGADAGAQEAPAQPAAEPPSIIHSPAEEPDREGNDLGVAVGATMFLGWIGTGYVMFRRASKRRTRSAPC